MNKYETVILISNKITKEQRENVIKKIKELISASGTIIDVEDIGERILAYEIRKHKKACYYVINFEANSDFVYELERYYRITEEIIKFITIRKDD